VVAVVGICTIIDMFRRGTFEPHPLDESYDFAVRLVILLGIPIVMYIALYWLFLEQLHKTGFGADFMLPDFQSSLEGHAKYGKFDKPSFWSKFYYLQSEMFRANKDIATAHTYQSYWYTWPVMHRPINSFVKGVGGGTTARVFLMGNPMVWWGALGGLVVSPLCLVLKSWWKRFDEQESVADIPIGYRSPFVTLGRSFQFRMLQLYLGYVLSLVPYALVARPCFVYHYMPSLLFSILLTAYAFDAVTHRLPLIVTWLVVLCLVGIFAWGFYFWSPIVYGWPLTKTEYESRNWMKSWV